MARRGRGGLGRPVSPRSRCRTTRRAQGAEERSSTMARTAVAYFRDRASADAALDALTSRGFSGEDIGVLGRGREGHKGYYDEHDHITAAEGAATGGIVGLL